MTKRSTLAIVSVVSATGASGCYSTWDIAPQSLTQLDGFQAGTTKPLMSVQNEQVDFTEETKLSLRGNDNRQVEVQWSSVRMEGPILVGRVFRPSSAAVATPPETQPVDLSQLAKLPPNERAQAIAAARATAPVKTPPPEELYVDVSRLARVQATNFNHGQSVGFGLGMGIVAIPVTAVAFAVSAFGILNAGFGGGRPLRVAGQTNPQGAPLLLGRRTNHASQKSRMDEVTRAHVLAHWAREASTESASVPAFLALGRDLARASSPSSLVRAALRAAREEVAHTTLCTSLANTHADVAISPVMPKVPRSSDVDHASLLERLVLEAFWDGCVAEGGAAVLAERSIDAAKDEATRLALQTIARDESNHAELARHIVAFGLSSGGRSIRNALRESFEQKRAFEEASVAENDDSPRDLDERMAQAHGLSNRTMRVAARVQTWEKAAAWLTAMT